MKCSQRLPKGKVLSTEIDSCGLQQINLNTSFGKKLSNKLKIVSNDKYAKDAIRSCQCGKLEIYYAWTLDYVKKYCNGCGAFEAKITNPSTIKL